MLEMSFQIYTAPTGLSAVTPASAEFVGDLSPDALHTTELATCFPKSSNHYMEIHLSLHEVKCTYFIHVHHVERVHVVIKQAHYCLCEANLACQSRGGSIGVRESETSWALAFQQVQNNIQSCG